MRLCVALGIVLTVLIALTVKARVRRPHHRPPPVDDHDEAVTDPSPPPRAAPEPPSFDPSAQALGPAHIFGRVLPPPGEPGGLQGLTVTADGGARSVEARTFSDGRFDLHLPPGQYAIVAAAGDWAGMAASVPARAGGEHEVTIGLGPTVSLRGRVRAPERVAELGVKVSPAERDDWDELRTIDGDGTFEVEGLVPGRTYDLLFEGEQARSSTVRAVTAPASDLLVQVDALPVLRGAIGVPGDEPCPISHVGLYAPTELPKSDDELDAEDERAAAVDDDCRFELTVPDGASQMMLLAVGAGWHLEQAISVPPVGEPAPVCLNPPCRAPDAQAKVTVSLEGAPAGGIHATLRAAGDEGGFYGCGSNAATCTFDRVAPGQTMTLEVGSSECATRTMTILPSAGPNTINVRCVPLPSGPTGAESGGP